MSDLDKAYQTQYDRATAFLYVLEVEIGAAPILSAVAVTTLLRVGSEVKPRERADALDDLETLIQKRWKEYSTSTRCTPANTRTFDQLAIGFSALKMRLARGY